MIIAQRCQVNKGSLQTCVQKRKKISGKYWGPFSINVVYVYKSIYKFSFVFVAPIQSQIVYLGPFLMLS